MPDEAQHSGPVDTKPDRSPPLPAEAPRHLVGEQLVGAVQVVPPREDWTPERIAMIKRNCCAKGASADEQDAFVEQCKRSGLDPLLKEAYHAARRTNVGTDERPNWITKHEFMPTEAGMLARAERFPDFLGCQCSAVFAEDDISIDTGKGEVAHKFNPAKRKGALVGAWARCVRQGKIPVLVWLDFAGYTQKGPLWAKIPMTMIEKCARVAALRKAFPSAFGGLYIREEMPPDEFDAPAAPAPAPAPPRSQQQNQQRRSGEQPAAKSSSSPSRPPAPPPAEAKPDERTAVAHAEVVVAFGPFKGKRIGELSDMELGEIVDLAHNKLTEQPTARWARAMREQLTSMEAEQELRAKVPLDPRTASGLPPPAVPEGRQPGDDDGDEPEDRDTTH